MSREDVLRECIGKILHELSTNSPRSEKLPSSIFERLLSALFKEQPVRGSPFSCCGYSESFVSTDVFSVSNVGSTSKLFVRFLLRMFGDVARNHDDICEKSSDFFMAAAVLSRSDSTIASAWLQTCKAIAECSASRTWLFSSGCVLDVFEFLKSDNVYVCRNAASVVSVLLRGLFIDISTKFDELQNLVTILFGNILQCASSVYAVRSSSSPNSVSFAVSEHSAAECARVIVEFTEYLHGQLLDASAIRNILPINLSKEETDLLVRLACQRKRLRHTCLCIVCVFCDIDVAKNAIPKDLLPFYYLRRLKIAALLSCTFTKNDWDAALEPLFTCSDLSEHFSYISSFAEFFRFLADSKFKRENVGIARDSLYQICFHLLQETENCDSSSSLVLPCLQFVTQCAKLYSSSCSRDLESVSESGISSKLNDALEKIVSKEDFSNRLSTELFRVVTSVLTEFWAQFRILNLEPTTGLVKETERFLNICIAVECSHQATASIRFSCSEAVLKIVAAVVGFNSDLPYDLTCVLKKWMPVAARTLSRCASSNIGFEDLVSIYSHCSRFAALSRLLLNKYYAEDEEVVNAVFEAIPVDRLASCFSTPVSALRQAAAVFILASSHVTHSSASSIAAAMLTNLQTTHSYDSDDLIVTILNCWYEHCSQHSRKDFTECPDAIKICCENFDDSNISNKPFDQEDCITTALKVCEDIITFLHSADDLPCVLIGATEGDQDNLDCEES